MNMQLHKEVDHKDFESIWIQHFFEIDELDALERKCSELIDAPPLGDFYSLIYILHCNSYHV